MPLYQIAGLLLIALIPSLAAAGDCADLIPSDAVLLVHLTMKAGDAGQKWAFNELTRYLIATTEEKEGRPSLDEVRLCRFADFCFALFPPDSQGHGQMLMAATLLSSDGSFGITYGDQKFMLNVRNTQTATRTQTQLLSLLLGLACRIPSGSVPDDGVFANPVGEKRGKFSAYSVSDERAIMATNKGLVKAARAGTPGITASPSYREAMALLPGGWDAYGYAHNEGGTLARMLKDKGEGWCTLILAFLAPARRLALALDVVDNNRSELALAIVPNNPKDIHELRVRLEQTLALLVTQYLDPGLASSITYEELPQALRISAKLANTAPFWREAFRVNAAKATRSGTPAKPQAKTAP